MFDITNPILDRKIQLFIKNDLEMAKSIFFEIRDKNVDMCFTSHLIYQQ